MGVLWHSPALVSHLEIKGHPRSTLLTQAASNHFQVLSCFLSLRNWGKSIHRMCGLKTSGMEATVGLWSLRAFYSIVWASFWPSEYPRYSSAWRFSPVRNSSRGSLQGTQTAAVLDFALSAFEHPAAPWANLFLHPDTVPWAETRHSVTNAWLSAQCTCSQAGKQTL